MCMIHLILLVVLFHQINGEPLNYLEAQWQFTQSSYSRSSSDVAQEKVIVKAGNGIYAFDFGLGRNILTPEPVPVTIDCGGVCVVTIWDCFCSGDSIIIKVGSTSSQYRLIPSDPGQCMVYQDDPLGCLADERFFLFQGTIATAIGTVNLVPYATRYGGGTGFIWVEKACTVSSTSVPCCQFSGSCNLTLADHIKIIPKTF